MCGAQAHEHETLPREVEFLLEAKIAPKAQGNHHVVVFLKVIKSNVCHAMAGFFRNHWAYTKIVRDSRFTRGCVND